MAFLALLMLVAQQVQAPLPPPSAPAPLAPAPPPAPPAAVKDVYDLPIEAFIRQVREDVAPLRRSALALRRIEEDLARTPHLLDRKRRDPYSPEEKQRLLGAWGAMFDHFVAVELIRQRYWNFVRHPVSDAARHAYGYLITHAALTIQMARGLTFVGKTQGGGQLEVILDDTAPEYGLPARAYADFKEKVVHVGTATQLYTGDAYRRVMETAFRQLAVDADPELRWLRDEIKADSKVARAHLWKSGIKMLARNAGDIVRDSTLRAFFPVQRAVAEWLGDTRVRRQGQPLIKREQVLALLAKMAPGDVVVARQNWYLSNIGLPGFWPHAELFLGTPAELSAAFDGDPAVSAWVATQPERVRTLSALLAARFPERWKAYGGTDFQGHGPIRVIESISEGVSFTSLEHAMLVDYLGVMRPRLGPRQKAEAVVRAFGYAGRPYDFDFDFFSDSTLVCTELVYKCYAPSAAEAKGFRIDLVDVAGRRTLPANEIVRLFDQEYDRTDRQFDFVGFLDGRESDRAAVVGDLTAFRTSWRRPKWDIAQK